MEAELSAWDLRTLVEVQVHSEFLMEFVIQCMKAAQIPVAHSYKILLHLYHYFSNSTPGRASSRSDAKPMSAGFCVPGDGKALAGLLSNPGKGVPGS